MRGGGKKRQTDTQTSEESNEERNGRIDEIGEEEREKREDGREIEMLMWLHKSHNGAFLFVHQTAKNRGLEIKQRLRVGPRGRERDGRGGR